MTTIAVRVPEDELEVLGDLIKSLGGNSVPAVARPFDGETVVQATIVLSAALFPYFRMWSLNRVAARKTFSIVHNGTELRGFTAAEVERLLNVLSAALPADDEAAGDDE